MKRWQLYSVVTIVLAMLSIGIIANRGGLFGKRTWHSKFGWKATDYFDDPKVLALCRAIEANDLEAMRLAIADGADVNALGEGNMTPLLWAFPDNHPERFELLLKSGADPNVFVESEFGVPRHAIQPGTSVTEMATKSVFREHFDLVFKYGGNPNLINPRTKCPILALNARS